MMYELLGMAGFEHSVAGDGKRRKEEHYLLKLIHINSKLFLGFNFTTA